MADGVIWAVVLWVQLHYKLLKDLSLSFWRWPVLCTLELWRNMGEQRAWVHQHRRLSASTQNSKVKMMHVKGGCLQIKHVDCKKDLQHIRPQSFSKLTLCSLTRNFVFSTSDTVCNHGMSVFKWETDSCQLILLSVAFFKKENKTNNVK